MLTTGQIMVVESLENVLFSREQLKCFDEHLREMANEHEEESLPEFLLYGGAAGS